MRIVPHKITKLSNAQLLNQNYLWKQMWILKFDFGVFSVSFIIVLSVSMRCSLTLRIYEHIWKNKNVRRNYSDVPDCRFPHKEFFYCYIGSESKHLLSWILLFWGSRPQQTMSKFLVISIARRKCLCVSGKLVLWSIYFYLKILVPMLYSKLWN